MVKSRSIDFTRTRRVRREHQRNKLDERTCESDDNKSRRRLAENVSSCTVYAVECGSVERCDDDGPFGVDGPVFEKVSRNVWSGGNNKKKIGKGGPTMRY